MTDFLIGCVIGAAAWYFVRCLAVILDDRAARSARDKARAALADRFRNRLKEPPKC